MSEEEKKILKFLEISTKINVNKITLPKEDIKTILDLYNKEKEKNKKLEKALAVANRLEIEIKKNFVNKDKIKDKIEELEEQLENTNTIEWQEIIKKQIEVLEDLLKEN